LARQRRCKQRFRHPQLERPAPNANRLKPALRARSRGSAIPIVVCSAKYLPAADRKPAAAALDHDDGAGREPSSLVSTRRPREHGSGWWRFPAILLHSELSGTGPKPARHARASLHDAAQHSGARPQRARAVFHTGANAFILFAQGFPRSNNPGYGTPPDASRTFGAGGLRIEIVRRLLDRPKRAVRHRVAPFSAFAALRQVAISR